MEFYCCCCTQIPNNSHNKNNGNAIKYQQIEKSTERSKEKKITLSNSHNTIIKPPAPLRLTKITRTHTLTHISHARLSVRHTGNSIGETL